MTRLDNGTLASLPDSVHRPAYDRAGLATGIVHLGIGNFHRAHQAEFTDDVLGLPGTPLAWGITGVSLRSPAVRDALVPQDGLYTVVQRDGSGARARVIGSVGRVLVNQEGPAAVLDAMTNRETRIVSLTVTEKGYCHDPATGDLDESHPAIVADLAHPDRPGSAIGLLAESLDRRRRNGTPPFTVLTCDNLPSNGDTVRKLVLRFAEFRDPELARWVEDTVAFPNTMVDRIVPATTDADRAEAADLLGVEDAWPVAAEPFRQWVIEDRFTAGRPEWDRVGAQLVSDVAPFELMKLRLLNGSHSTLAYLGVLAGHETVDAVMAVPSFDRLIRSLMANELAPTVPPPPDMDMAAYQIALCERFANPALKHRTRQIAMDGSQKLPQRLLEAARDRLDGGQPLPLIALGVAAWCRYVGGVDEAGQPITVDDPLADRLQAASDSANVPAGKVAALLAVQEVFGTDLATSDRFVAPVTEAYESLVTNGASATVEAWAAQSRQ
ncbi:MAG: mannitol dehydrogenase family protein [Pseudomonadota bacterium]